MTVLDTPLQISTARLASLRAVLRMEKVGMKGRAGPIRPKIAAELGLKPRDSYDLFIMTLTDMIEANIKEIQS